MPLAQDVASQCHDFQIIVLGTGIHLKSHVDVGNLVECLNCVDVGWTQDVVANTKAFSEGLQAKQ